MRFGKFWPLAVVVTMVACSSGEQLSVNESTASELARDMLQRSAARTLADADKFPDVFVASLPDDATARFWDLYELSEDRFEVVFRFEDRDLVRSCLSFREQTGWVALPESCPSTPEGTKSEHTADHDSDQGDTTGEHSDPDPDRDQEGMTGSSTPHASDSAADTPEVSQRCGVLTVDYIASPAQVTGEDDPQLEVLFGSYVMWQGTRFPLQTLTVDTDTAMLVLGHGDSAGRDGAGLDVRVPIEVGEDGSPWQDWIAAVAAGADRVELLDPSKFLQGEVPLSECSSVQVTTTNHVTVTAAQAEQLAITGTAVHS